MTQSSKPNIIVIMSDEHDPAVTGCYGDPIVRTPRLDALAAEGIRFNACYTNSPLCVPCRQSFTAGQYVSRIGAWNNNCCLRDDAHPTLPNVLNANGYESFLCGKMHYESTRRYGFTELYLSNKGKMNGHGERRAYDDETVKLKNWQARIGEFHPGDDSGILNHDRKVTENAVKFLQERSPQDAPFFLLAGYLAPHFPLIVPQEIYDYYVDKVPMPNVPEGLIDNLPTNYKHLRRGFGMVDQPADVVKRGRELYWALTDWLDRQIGQVLDTLNDSSFADNTIIIYVSDHGENKGDHGLWWKNNMYEHGARIPCIFHFPKKWKGGQVREGACSLVDVVQTIADLAGAEAPDKWDGDSLLPVLDNADAPWKNFAVSEYYAHNIASGFTMYREGSFKYVYHNRFDADHPGERELYDLATDPGELNNLAGLPLWEDKVTEMHAKLVAELGEEPDAIEERCRRDIAAGYAAE
ncbi:MAG: Sulfatase [Paenibacillaceae bacterium]|nr:Sulfatase [Paenibacillaceae bacterium]